MQEEDVPQIKQGDNNEQIRSNISLCFHQFAVYIHKARINLLLPEV